MDDDDELKKLKPITISVVRRLVPNMIANDIVSVQPMSINFGNLFTSGGVNRDKGPLSIGRVQEKRFTVQLWFNNIANITLSDAEAAEIDSWCKEQGFGKRTSYDMWQFESEEEILMFTLRWGGGRI